MSKTEKADADEAAPKGKKKLLTIVLAAVLLLGAGGGGYFMLAGGSAEAAEAEAPVLGAVVPLEPVTINLADGHYLKMAFALQAIEEVTHEPEGSKAMDLAISQYTDMKIAELSTAKGREAAKKELVEKIKKAYHDEVVDIYFTQFVTQ